MVNYQAVRDKLRVYRLEADISKGHEFIDELNQILKYRQQLQILTKP
jgi:hypothetical protein